MMKIRQMVVLVRVDKFYCDTLSNLPSTRIIRVCRKNRVLVLFDRANNTNFIADWQSMNQQPL